MGIGIQLLRSLQKNSYPGSKGACSRINVLMMLQAARSQSMKKHTNTSRDCVCVCGGCLLLSLRHSSDPKVSFNHSCCCRWLLLGEVSSPIIDENRLIMVYSWPRNEKDVLCAARQREQLQTPSQHLSISPEDPALNVLHRCCWCSEALCSQGNASNWLCLFLALSVYYFHG